MRFVILPVNDAGSEVGALVVAARLSAVAFGPADLLRSMVLVMPLILLASGVLGWFLAGRAMRPVERLMDEVQEVTDGRSLHRRVAVPNSGDELARLAVTLNAMFSRLEQSFSQLRRFTADASHELKTPLMVLRAGVERSLVHPGTPGEVLEALDTTLGQLNQLNELVDSLLTLARADEGRAPLALEVRDLRALVVDVGETAEMLGEQHGLTTRVDGAGPPRRGAGGPAPDAPVAAQPGDQRREVHAGRRVGGGVAGGSGGGGAADGARHRNRDRVGRRAAHLRPVLAGRPGPLAAPATARASDWGSPSPSGSPRPTADRFRSTADQGGGRASRCCCPGLGLAGWGPRGRLTRFPRSGVRQLLIPLLSICHLWATRWQDGWHTLQPVPDSPRR